MLRLGWMQYTGAGGYARVGEELRIGVEKAGAEILEYTDWEWDACIHVSPPRAAMLGRDVRSDVVIHTMIECDRAPRGWVKLLNRTGMLWVPSQYSMDVFRSEGVTIPILKTPYGVNPEWEYQQRERGDGPFRVLAWGDSLSSRKNLTASIEAFIKADLPDSVLEVKITHPLMPDRAIWNDGKKDHENIIILNGPWKDWEVIQWVQSGHVGIYLSSGEGYGLMPKEMMRTGLPMITMINTGMLEYLRPDLVREVPSIQRPSRYWKRIFDIDVEEPYPIVDAAVEELRWAYDHPDELVTLGRIGSEHVQQYTWEKAGQLAYEGLLNQFGQ